MSSNQSLEIEVKFHIGDSESIRRRLIGLGAASLGQVFEKNLCYEDAANSLQAKGCLLRLRQDSACRLTYKCPPTESSTDFKIYRELEVTVSDARSTDAILNAVGFRAVQSYEKWRESFVLENVQICIDTMPFGSFLEIEGPRVPIKDTARSLGLRWEERILTNYLAIFHFLRRKFQWPFSDVTFDNFASVACDFSVCRHHFYAAPASIEEDAIQ